MPAYLWYGLPTACRLSDGKISILIIKSLKWYLNQWEGIPNIPPLGNRFHTAEGRNVYVNNGTCRADRGASAVARTFKRIVSVRGKLTFRLLLVAVNHFFLTMLRFDGGCKKKKKNPTNSLCLSA